jgi:Fibronectin type III domain
MSTPKRAIACLAGVAVLACAGTSAAQSGSGGDRRPIVAGTTANSITASTAVLRATVNPNERDTSYRFEYGTSLAYGSATALTYAGDSNAAAPVSVTVTGLEPSTTYHFRVVATSDKGTTRGPDRTFTTLAAEGENGGLTPPPGSEEPGTTPTAPPPTPDLGASVVAAPASGELLVRRPNSSQFVPLELGAELPMGTIVDATNGTLAITSALPRGGSQTGRFGGGLFAIRQGRRGYLDLFLRGRLACGDSGVSTASVAAAAAKKKRRLWGKDHGGRFRTHGRNSHATVRGTRWVVVDTCRGTLTRVTSGSVIVTDKVRDKRVRVDAGERYLARPRR